MTLTNQQKADIYFATLQEKDSIEELDLGLSSETIELVSRVHAREAVLGDDSPDRTPEEEAALDVFDIAL